MSRFETQLTPVAPAAPAAGAPGAAARVKPMTSLKPKVITRDATPVELTSWIKKFTAFFVGSQFAEATIIEQQAHFRASLDSYLVNKVDIKIKPATPVLVDPTGVDKSCIDILKEEFLVLRPLFSRRLDYFNYRQQKGCLLYTSPSPRDKRQSRMPSSA